MPQTGFAGHVSFILLTLIYRGAGRFAEGIDPPGPFGAPPGTERARGGIPAAGRRQPTKSARAAVYPSRRHESLLKAYPLNIAFNGEQL